MPIVGDGFREDVILAVGRLQDPTPGSTFRMEVREGGVALVLGPRDEEGAPTIVIRRDLPDARLIRMSVRTRRTHRDMTRESVREAVEALPDLMRAVIVDSVLES